MTGLDNISELSVRLDELVVIEIKFKEDERDQSWELLCGKAQSTTLFDQPSFIKLSENEKSIFVQPIDEKDLGIHSMLIQ